MGDQGQIVKSNLLIINLCTYSMTWFVCIMVVVWCLKLAEVEGCITGISCVLKISSTSDPIQLLSQVFPNCIKPLSFP